MTRIQADKRFRPGFSGPVIARRWTRRFLRRLGVTAKSSIVQSGAGLLLLAGMAACRAAGPADAQTIERPDPAIAEQIKLRPSQLCAGAPRTSSHPGIRNDDKRTLGEIFGIARNSIVIQYRSAEWNSPEDVAHRAREIIEARPRFLSAHIIWSEGADLRRHAFVTMVQLPDGTSARLEVAGYQVCMRDTGGRYWYFRNLPLDLW